MQFRMIARRAPTGSITVLGDLAQATGPWAYADWREIRVHLPETAPVQHDELTLGYRAPGKVLDFASRLLPVAAPGISPTASIRPGRTEPVVRTVEPTALADAALAEAARSPPSTRWSPSSSPKSSCTPSPGWPGATPRSETSNATP